MTSYLPQKLIFLYYLIIIQSGQDIYIYADRIVYHLKGNNQGPFSNACFIKHKVLMVRRAQSNYDWTLDSLILMILISMIITPALVFFFVFSDKTPSPLNHIDVLLDGTYKQVFSY